MKDYVTTVLRDGRAHAGLQQFLNLSHDLVFVFLTCCRCRPGYWIAEQDGPTGGKMLHDNGKYRRL